MSSNVRPGPLGMQIDDRRPEGILWIDLRHDFRGAFVAQLGPTQDHRNLVLKRRLARTPYLRNHVCGRPNQNELGSAADT